MSKKHWLSRTDRAVKEAQRAVRKLAGTAEDVANTKRAAEQAGQEVEKAKDDYIEVSREHAKTAKLVYGYAFRRMFVELSLRRKRRAAGRKGAKVRWEDREPVAELIESLAPRTDELGDPLPPSELWPKLFPMMEDHCLNPDEPEPGLPLDRSYYVYANGQRLTYEAFARRIQRARQ